VPTTVKISADDSMTETSKLRVYLQRSKRHHSYRAANNGVADEDD
jgi:hypothetical protein